jgi:hypothetical protein
MRHSLLALVAVVSPSLALAVVPEEGGPVVLSPVQIHVGPGNQFHPHVDVDLVSYTDVESVRYFSFATLSNDVVPVPADTVDQFSDVSGVTIVFQRLDPDLQARILVHDTTTTLTTEVDPQVPSQRINPSIGGSTIAFSDLAIAGLPGEISVAEPGGTGATRLTFNTTASRRFLHPGT